MKILNIFMTVVFMAVLCSCNRDEIFEREQYKHVIALLSEGISNIFAEEHDLSTGDANGYTEGYIAASCGGSLLTTEDVTLKMVEDPDLLREYNNNSFAMESYKYARYMPADRYSIASPVLTIPKGERSGRMKIRLRAGGLSPDSVYLIPFRVIQTSAYELNQEKNTVLYRVYMKNFWASTKSIPLYSHRGSKIEVGATSLLTTMTTKNVFPLSGDEVRMCAGNKNFSELTEGNIERWMIRLKISNDGKVTISPWSTSRFGMKVTQVDGDPDYPNVFNLVDNGYGKFYKTFLLCYNYTDPDENVVYSMKEELKIEHVVTVK